MNDTVTLLQGFRRICVLCPHCSAVSRLSDTTPYYRGRPPATPWDRLEKLDASVQRARDRLEADRDAIRQRQVARGRREMRRRLEGLTRFYRRRRIALEDLKLVFDPVDYVAFRGLGERQCTSIEFIDCEATSRRQERIQRSLSHALEAGNVSWVTMRVADDGNVTCTSSPS
jgi:predicted Holliday junction resolvase-like endonuclease